MARYKPVDYAQGQFVSVQFEKQILPGTFEHTLNYIVDERLDFGPLDRRRKNDDAGAPAYDPRVMLKIVLCAYERGMFSSREIAEACEQNVVMMALSANSRPHHTTIAQFIRELGEDAEGLFLRVLLHCDHLGLLGKEVFAVDGCKLPSNASKEWSGTRQDFERRKAKLQERLRQLLNRHRDKDKDDDGGSGSARRERGIENTKAKIDKLERWLDGNPEDRKGVGGQPIKSSITDPDSAKMASGKGVIQGYNAVAVVDGKHQVIVAPQAFGQSHEASLLGPMLEQTRQNLAAIGAPGALQEGKLVADCGFHSKESVALLEERGIDGFLPDNQFRKRQSAFETAGRHRKPGALIGRNRRPNKYFKPADFVFDPASGKLICPAGKELYKSGAIRTRNGFHGSRFRAKKTDCRACPLRAKCLRSAASEHRQVAKFEGRELPQGPSAVRRMMAKIDSEAGRFLYSMRMGIVEPVFANIRHMLGLDRFTLRGRQKVNVQWTLYAMVHNLGKVQRFGLAGTG